MRVPNARIPRFLGARFPLLSKGGTRTGVTANLHALVLVLHMEA